MMRLAERLSQSKRKPPADRPDPALWATEPTRPEPLTFRRAPALWAAFFFCVGISASRFIWHPSTLWLAAALILLALVSFALTRHVRTEFIRLVPLAALWLIAGVVSAALQPAPPTQAALRTFADGLSRTIRGHVIRVRVLPPLPIENPDTEGYEEPEPPSTLSVDLAVDAVEDVTPDLSTMVPVTGGIRATIIADAPIPTLTCGQTIEIPMRLRVPERYRDPGAWQYGDYLLAQGIGAHASIHSSRITLTTPTSHELSPQDLQCRFYAAQAWAAARMIAYARSPANQTLPSTLRLTPDDAGMLNAMLFGDRAGLNHTLRVGFERTGSFHLFVVSGMHIGLIALGLFWLARSTRLPLWAATFLTITLTAAYAALTGFGVPVQRALWMATVFLLARLLDRRRNTLNAFGLAILAVLVWSPSSLFDASFQMTFLAIVGVAGISIPLGERTILPYAHATRKLDDIWLDIRFPPHLAQFRVMLRVVGEPIARLLGHPARNLPAILVRAALWAIELCLIGIVTEAVMSLPMAIYFHRATLFALPANLVSVPVIGLLVPAALATFTAALLTPWAAMLPGAITSLMLHAITGAVGRIARAQSADLRVPQPATLACLLAAATLAFCFWAVRREGKAWGWLAVAALPLVVAAVLGPAAPIYSAGLLEVTAIDVGQGDSLLITSPAGSSMLIDAGGPIGGPGNRATTQSTGFDIGEEVVAPYLWSRHIRRLDVVALTHEHSDHMGGMIAILKDFRPRELWLGLDVPSPTYQALLAEATTLGITIRHFRAGDTSAWDGVQIAVLAPEPTYVNRSSPKNDDSLVLYLQFGASSVLLEGDAEKPEERTMLDQNRIQPVTLLKVGHHGSSTSSTENFLAAAAPRDAIISVGQGNPFGHPRTEVISRFAEHRIKLYRTDMFGLTTFLLSRDGGIRELTGTSN